MHGREASCQGLQGIIDHSHIILASSCKHPPMVLVNIHQSVALNSPFSTLYHTPNLIAIQITAASFSPQHPHSCLDLIPAQERMHETFDFLKPKRLKTKERGVSSGPDITYQPTTYRLLWIPWWSSIPGAYTRLLYPCQGTGVWVGRPGPRGHSLVIAP